jgi:hypothetical protein
VLIWYILWWFGTFFRFWYHVPRSLWQPWCERGRAIKCSSSISNVSTICRQPMQDTFLLLGYHLHRSRFISDLMLSFQLWCYELRFAVVISASMLWIEICCCDFSLKQCCDLSVDNVISACDVVISTFMLWFQFWCCDFNFDFLISTLMLYFQLRSFDFSWETCFWERSRSRNVWWSLDVGPQSLIVSGTDVIFFNIYAEKFGEKIGV